MDLELLLPPVAEVHVFPWTASFPSLQPPRHSPSPIHVLSVIWMGMSEATSNTCSTPCCPPPSPSQPPTATTTMSLLPCYQPVFLCPAHISRCCVIYSSLGDMWSLCWIPRTPGSQCFWRRRRRKKKEEGKQSDKTSWLSGHSVRPENVQILPEQIMSVNLKLNKEALYSMRFPMT